MKGKKKKEYGKSLIKLCERSFILKEKLLDINERVFIESQKEVMRKNGYLDHEDTPVYF